MVNDLEQAEIKVIKLVQAVTFQKEIKTLKELQADIKCESQQSEKERKVATKKTSSLHMYTGSILGLQQSSEGWTMNPES